MIYKFFHTDRPIRYKSSRCLIGAARSNRKAEEERLSGLRGLLEGTDWEPREVLAEMDGVIADFVHHMEVMYRVCIRYKGSFAREADLDIYHRSLRGYMHEAYPWLSEEANDVLEGRFGYR